MPNLPPEKKIRPAWHRARFAEAMTKTLAFRRTCAAALLFALGAALQPGLRAADQPQFWRMSDPAPSCRLLLQRWQTFGQGASPTSASERFVATLAEHKRNVQAVIDQTKSIPTTVDKLDRLHAQFADKSASSGITVPDSLSLYDPGSYYEWFKSHYDPPEVIRIFEVEKRAIIKDQLSWVRFRSPEDRDNFVASRMCGIVNLYLDMLNNKQESQMDWKQLIENRPVD